MTENNHVFGVHFGVLFSISTENISAFALYLLRSSRTLKFIPFRIKKQIPPHSDHFWFGVMLRILEFKIVKIQKSTHVEVLFQ